MLANHVSPPVFRQHSRDQDRAKGWNLIIRVIGMPITANVLNLIRGFINQRDLWIIRVGL